MAKTKWTEQRITNYLKTSDQPIQWNPKKQQFVTAKENQRDLAKAEIYTLPTNSRVWWNPIVGKYQEVSQVKQPKYTVGTEVSSFYASWRVVEVYNNFAELRHKDPEEAEAAMMARLDSRNNKESEEELMSQPWYGMKGTSMMSSGGMIDYKPQSALDNMTVDK